MPSYQDFKNAVLGKGFDIDGYYGAQCWDGYAYYCKFMGVPYANCTVTGYAEDIWTQRKTNGILNYFDEVSEMEAGDVAVFKKSPFTPDTHIAIFDSDAGNGYGNFLGQNQGGAPTPTGGGVFNITKIPYSATFDTAFRLKSKKEGRSTVKGIPTKTVNGDLFSGLVTRVDPNIMNADSNRTTVDRIVIHHNAGTSDENARRTWYVSTGVGTSAHYQVTDKDIWGCVGEGSVAYHAGNYNMNQRSIGIEHLNNAGAPSWTIAEGTYQNSAKLIADIATRYNIPIDRQHVIPHRDVVPTACPGGIDVDRLIRMAKEIASGGVVNQQLTTTPTVNSKMTVDSFRVRVSVSDLNIRKEPSLKAKTNGVAKAGVYTITATKQADGYEWGKLKSGAGWIALKYAKRL